MEKEFARALRRARIELERWRNRRVGREPYSNAVLRALAKAVQLGGALKVSRALGVDWNRLRKLSDDPRFVDEPIRSNKSIETSSGPAAVDEIAKQEKDKQHPLVTFTQFVPVGDLFQETQSLSRERLLLEVELPQGMVFRVWDGNTAVLEMIKSTMLAMHARGAP